MDLAHKLGAYFGYGTRHNDLIALCEGLGDVALIRIKVDYNTTRIAAVHGLLLSEIRLHRGLQAFELKFKPGWGFATADWVTAREFEGVLNCTRLTSTLAQIETGYMGAFTCLIKTLTMKKLRSDTISGDALRHDLAH